MHRTDQTTDSEAPAADDQFLRAMREANTEEAALQSACIVSARLALAAATVEEIERQLPEDRVPLDRQLFSIGRLCQILGVSPIEVRAAMQLAAVKISMTLNETIYLDAHALLAIRDELRRQGRYPSRTL